MENYPDAKKQNRQALAAVAIIIVAFLVAVVYANSGGPSPIPAPAPKVTSYSPGQTAALADGTTIDIIDVREEQGILANQTVITIIYTAGPEGHHPSREQNTITPSRGDTVVADDSMSIGTVKRLDTALAPNIQRELRIGFNIPIQDLYSAQLNLDTAIFAGDFTGRINPNG